MQVLITSLVCGQQTMQTHPVVLMLQNLKLQLVHSSPKVMRSLPPIRLTWMKPTLDLDTHAPIQISDVHHQTDVLRRHSLPTPQMMNSLTPTLVNARLMTFVASLKMVQLQPLTEAKHNTGCALNLERKKKSPLKLTVPDSWLPPPSQPSPLPPNSEQAGNLRWQDERTHVYSCETLNI